MDKEMTMAASQTTFEFEHQGETTPSETVIHAVAEAADVDPLELDPLHSTIDPDALDALFAPKYNGQPRDGDLQLTFSMAGYKVIVWSYGRVSVTEETPGEHTA